MKLRVFCMIIIFSSFYIISPQVKAEPTLSVKWLTEEPASLFDIGMMRLRELNDTKWIPELIKKISFLGVKLSNSTSGSAVYNLDKNIIDVEVSLVGKPAEKVCVEILKQYKNIIFPSVVYTSPTSLSSIAICFDHINYSIVGRPKNIDNDILKIIKITVGISEKEDWLNAKSIYCSCSLFDDTPSFSKYGF